MRALLAFGFVAFALPAFAGEEGPAPVVASIGKEAAWVGERVPLTIVLRSPGPFSGTAAFDLPQLPKTAILKVGRPVVGSETVAGVSMITQRHEFALFTQQVGEVTLPPFRIRFEGKPDFTSDPEPVEGRTGELRFESKRPPGSEGMGVVLSTASMEVDQVWQPAEANLGELAPGDVVTRKVTRKANGTTAMMFPPIPESAPEGVRVYPGQPAVNDKTDRGASSAERVDTIKYQFPTPGSYAIPELEFVWWDPERSELRQATLPGLTVSVSGTVSTGPEVSEGRRSGWLLWLGLGLLVVASIIGLALYRRVRAEKGGVSETELARQVRDACRSNDPAACYAAVLEWLRLAAPEADDPSTAMEALGHEWDELTGRLFGDRAPESTPWSGAGLLGQFRIARRQLMYGRRASSGNAILPSLNPS